MGKKTGLKIKIKKKREKHTHTHTHTHTQRGNCQRITKAKCRGRGLWQQQKNVTEEKKKV